MFAITFNDCRQPSRSRRPDTAKSSITGTSRASRSSRSVQIACGYGISIPATAGTAYQFVVLPMMLYGNVATGYTGIVSFPAVTPKRSFRPTTPSQAAMRGQPPSPPRSRPQASSRSRRPRPRRPGITGKQSGITVQAAQARLFLITGLPKSVQAGTSLHLHPHRH